MALIGSDSSSSSLSISTTAIDESNATAAPSGSFGNTVVLSDASIGTLETTDLGAIQAGQGIAQEALSSTLSGFQTLSSLAGQALNKATETIDTRAESPIDKILGPLLWFVGIGAVLVVGGLVLLKKVFK